MTAIPNPAAARPPVRAVGPAAGCPSLASAGTYPLSFRDEEVVIWRRQGRTFDEIAHHLGIGFYAAKRILQDAARKGVRP